MNDPDRHSGAVSVRTVGVVVALIEEATLLVKSLSDRHDTRIGPFVIHEGRLSGKKVAVVISGVGGAARAAVQALVESITVDLIINMGFAGGLIDELPRGSIVVSGRTVAENGARETSPIGGRITIPPPGKTGVVLTTRRFIQSVATKKELAQRYDAVAVDMEGGFVAGAARDAGIPFLIVRVISDDLSAELPIMGAVLTKKGRLDPGRAIIYFLRNPRTLMPFVRFMRDLRPLSDALNRYLERLIGIL